MPFQLGLKVQTPQGADADEYGYQDFARGVGRGRDWFRFSCRFSSHERCALVGLALVGELELSSLVNQMKSCQINHLKAGWGQLLIIVMVLRFLVS